MMREGLVIAGKYRVQKKLGEGAMGSVWLATNEMTEREFAIKVLLPQIAAGPTALGRFFQEAKVCGSLRHPSILEIYDAGVATELDGAPYLVMERLDGAALDALIRQRGALPPALAVDVVAQIARGLDKAHEKGIIHRDLKPANVFLHRPGSGAVEPKVLDFGISKIIDRNTPSVKFTETSALVGSPLYMSTEHLAGDQALDGRSDVHALGVVLWECLTGLPPFTSTSYNLVVVEILKGPRPRLRDALPSASDSLAAVVERAFAIDRNDRFPTAAAFADALDVELAKLGGGVLASRAAAVDVLGGLVHVSKIPPPPDDPDAIEDTRDALAVASAPLVLTSPNVSPLSLSDTEYALPGVPASAASPVTVLSHAGPMQAPRREASMGPRVGVVAVLVAVAALIAFVAWPTGLTPPVTGVAPEARHAEEPPVASPVTVAPIAPPSLPAVPSKPTPSASVAPPVTLTPSRVVAPAAPPAPLRPKIDTSGLPKAPASTARPRIDQAGLPPPTPPPRIDQSGL